MSLRQLSSGQWQIRWTDSDGKRRTESHRTKRQAEAALVTHLDNRARGVHEPRKILFSDFVAEWEAGKKRSVRPQTWKASYEPHLSRAKERFGDLRLGRVDARECQRYVDELAADLSPATTRNAWAVLRMILRSGHARGLCRAPQPGEVLLPAKGQRDIGVIPSAGEIEALRMVIDARFIPAIRLAAYSGLRLSEILGLTPEAVDWHERRIHIHQSLSAHTHKLGQTKSGRDRWVTMPQLVHEDLEDHYQAYPPNGLVFTVNSKPVSATWFDHKVFDAARRAIGYGSKTKPGPKGWTRFHNLRHAAPAFMAKAGWSVGRVKEELGHGDAAFTINVYGHLFIEDSGWARGQLDDALGAAVRDAKERETTR